MSYLYGAGNYVSITEQNLQGLLLFCVWPGWINGDSKTLWDQYMPIFTTLDAAGWNALPLATATSTSGTVDVERFGPDASGAQYFTVGGPPLGNGGTHPAAAQGVTVTLNHADLGWSSNPNVTVTSLFGTAPSTSYDGSGNLVLNFGTLNSESTDVVKVVYNGTSTLPKANFSASATTGTSPLSVNFTDTSTQSPTSWYWSFGDGNHATSQNPSHTFASGWYTVSLTATNSTGSGTITRPEYIVASGAPAADFVGSPRSGWDTSAGGLAVYFRDRSTNFPTSWSWTFGDGGTSNLRAAQHTYGSGTYTVALTATNSFGSNTCTKSNT